MGPPGKQKPTVGRWASKDSRAGKQDWLNLKSIWTFLQAWSPFIPAVLLLILAVWAEWVR